MRKILLRFDDLCPTMDYDQWEKTRALIRENNVKAMLCVIPSCLDPDLLIEEEHLDFWQEIRQLQNSGCVVALHGYQHICNREKRGLVSIRKWSEFSGLSYADQYSKIQSGVMILKQHGISTDIFVAPSHSYDRTTLKALYALGFKYISDGKTSKKITRHGIVCVPCRSSGVPTIRKKGLFTAIFHPSEWSKQEKSCGYEHLKRIVSLYHDEICGFYDYCQAEDSGNYLWQLLVEKQYIFWVMMVKEKMSFLLKKIKSIPVVKYCVNRTYRFYVNDRLGMHKYYGDEEYLRAKFFNKMGKALNLKTPKTFNEKLQWLKLYDRKPIYTTMVDKYEAKQYVAGIIGEKHIIPTLGVWDRFDDIDFSSLPDQFVLKCTHDSGGLVICKDKNSFDKKAARKRITKCLKRNYYWSGREWPYKDVKPRIIAEQYINEDSTGGLQDYKFFCFNGEPKFLYISRGLDNHSTASMSFVNIDWTLAPYERSDYKQFLELPPRPACFDSMIEIARELSKNTLFLRVDLYQIMEEVYFSELTFYPCSGFMPFKKPEYDLQLGDMIHLPGER